MDYRCPLCRADVGKRKSNRAVLTGLSVECPHCRRKIPISMHPLETAIVMVDFGAIVILATLAYLYQSREFALAALGAVMVGALALPLVESTVLRRWPRYAPPAQSVPGTDNS